MRVLITGGAGFIGSHLARALAPAAEVRVLDDLRTGHRRNLAGARVEFRQASILDRAAVRAALAGIDTVYHLAALVSVPESVRDPALCEAINVTGFRTVLEEALAAGVRRLCFASSCAVYGDDPVLPKRETLPPAPGSPYAASKLAGEALSAEFTARGLPCAALRFFNVYGPRQDPASPYAAAIPAFIVRALRGEPLLLHGDGEQTRDFVYVGDVVAALRHVAARPALGGVFNVAGGRSVTVRALAEQVVALTRSVSSIRHAPERPGDVRHSLAAVDRLAAAGFRAGTPLELGLRTTIAWYRRRLQRQDSG
jgi:UDP-glucose 4-epimerase